MWSCSPRIFAPALLATPRRKRVEGAHLVARAISASSARRHAAREGGKPADFKRCMADQHGIPE